MHASIARWGNSLAVRIPEPIADALDLSDGARVQLEVEDGVLVLRPLPLGSALDDLLSRITPDNLPDESFDDAPLGRERL